MKTKEEIRATTTGKIPRPADWEYGQKLKEWDASLPAGSEDLLVRCQPINDRLLVRLIGEAPKSSIILTDPNPLIGGMRKALVLKCGPGRWMPGEWWKVGGPHPDWKGLPPLVADDLEYNEHGTWQWFAAYRRPVSVAPGQTVYIGNWVDLEAKGLALCQEGDIRGYV